jgi:hypothetical protein
MKARLAAGWAVGHTLAMVNKTMSKGKEMRIRDEGNGWQVWTEWLGDTRPVFSSDPNHHPLIQLQDCFDFVRSMR